MHEYDVAFKLILRESADLTLRELAGTAIATWHNVELPETNARLDLLGESAAGELVHIELQSTNDPTIPRRMAEYYLKIDHRFARFATQVVLYVGQAPLAMPAEYRSPKMRHSFRMADVRELDGASLLRSPWIGDNIIAVFARVPDSRRTVHEVLERIAGLEEGARQTAPDRLAIVAGLRKLGQVIKEESERMPILDDILDHDLLGPEFRKGELKGRVEGELKGRVEGEQNLLRLQIAKRFGTLPAWAEARLAGRTLPELEALGLRLLEAGSLEELLP